MTHTNPLRQLADFGQSVWVDNLSREMIESGELQRLIDEDGVVGITSNPTIFDTAISKSDDYEGQMRELVAAGRSPMEVLDELMIRDIQDACDILRPVFDSTGGRDGVVSIEVSPFHAHNTEETIAEARRLNRLVARPNVMVKIPGTPEGIPAIEQALYEGVNINITLLFSLDAYRQVMNAYLNAMERRVADGKPVDHIVSVASFFVSRVDSEVDARLQAIVDEDPNSERAAAARALMGQVAIANARLAYQEFKRVFNSDRFAQLAGMGVPIQRPLWASTSTKNPDYPDTLYIDELIGPNTVQTMAPASIDAFRDHGTVALTVEKNVDLASDAIETMESLGIAYDDVIDTLVREGVEKFADSHRSLINSVEQECRRIVEEERVERREALGALSNATQAEIDALDQTGAIRALQAADPAFWSDDKDVQKLVSERLGWLQSVAEMSQLAEAGVFRALSAEVRQRGYDRAVLLGMGGSSLAPEVMAAIDDPDDGYPALDVLDTTNPDTIARYASRMSTERTLFIVSSKSGTTIETSTLFDYFLDVNDSVADDFIIITDPGSQLEVRARNAGVWKVFTNRHDIGGRYSALSYFGLVPAAIAGLDVNNILASASSLLPIHSLDHQAVWLGAALAAAQKQGRDKLTVLATGDWEAFGDWLEQLIAESTGKQGTGIIPIVREPVLDPAAYRNDRIFVVIEDGRFEGLVRDLREHGHPVIRQQPDLGTLFLTWEIATAVAGQRLSINPFNEPNVQEAKDATNDVLSRQTARDVEGQDPRAAIERVLSGVGKRDYVAIMAFVDPTPENQAALQRLREEIASRSGAATTLGFGPRFLHSTGQLHKGGPVTGVFLQIVQVPSEWIDIPGRNFGFADLFAAQSAGDFLTLQKHGLRVARVQVEGDLAETLNIMVETARNAAVAAD